MVTDIDVAGVVRTAGRRTDRVGENAGDQHGRPEREVVRRGQQRERGGEHEPPDDDTGEGHPDVQHPFFHEVLGGLKPGVGLILAGAIAHAFARGRGDLGADPAGARTPG